MSNRAFQHYDLRLVRPQWDDELATIVIELEKLRFSPLGGSVQPLVFFQLKGIFQLLESLESARIEGNQTTLQEAVEQKIAKTKLDERAKELSNIEDAMAFIEENIDRSGRIERAFIQEIHRIVVSGLTREGDSTPGKYRNRQVIISGSGHMPPSPMKVPDYMNELIGFINEPREKKYDMLATAVAHHRFAWVHPFTNGNGRVVRLLTYAMLIQQGFSVDRGRIINPAAIFFADRELYYAMLAAADQGTDKGALEWSRYMLRGLLSEIKKIDKLLDPQYLTNVILLPAVHQCEESRIISSPEADVLRIAAEKFRIVAGDLIDEVGPSPLSRSRILSKLKEKDMLIPTHKNARQYVISFSNNYLLRGVIKQLRDNGFITEEKLPTDPEKGVTKAI